MIDKEAEELIEYLSEYILEERLNNFNQILEKRTNHLTVVLEDLHKPHNANAVLRSCDGFGLQDIHVIENKTEFDAERSVTLGAHKWLTLHRYNDPQEDNIDACFSELRSQGYKIIATTPHENDVNIQDLDVSQKTALVFGTERKGISREVEERVDGFVKIPMYGFSESFNISVSAAICMFELTTKLRNLPEEQWQLDEKYKTELRLKWIIKTIKASEQLIARFHQQREKRG